MKFELCPISADQRIYLPPNSDFIELLGGNRDIPAEGLKKMFRRIVKIVHPDVNDGSEASERMFGELNAAYEILSDPEKRSAHFALLEETAAASSYAAYFGPRGDMAPGVHVFEERTRWQLNIM